MNQTSRDGNSENIFEELVIFWNVVNTAIELFIVLQIC